MPSREGLVEFEGAVIDDGLEDEGVVASPATTDNNSLAPRSFRVTPSSRIASPASLNHCVVVCLQSPRLKNDGEIEG